MLIYSIPWCDDDPELGQEPANLIGLCRARFDETLAGAMQRQHRLLLAVLDRHEAHTWPAYRFADRLGIRDVMLVRLDVRLDELRRHELHRVPERLKAGAAPRTETRGNRDATPIATAPVVDSTDYGRPTWWRSARPPTTYILAPRRSQRQNWRVPTLELYSFRFRDPLTGKWIRARHKMQVPELQRARELLATIYDEPAAKLARPA